MYGSISTQQHKKYLSLVSYKITGDNIGVISGFFRVLFNAIKLRSIQLSTVQSTNGIERTWVELLTNAFDGLTVNLSKLDIHQQDLQHSYSGVNFMRLINNLIMSLPNQLRELFVMRMQCQSCKLVQSTVTTLLKQKCTKCDSQLRIIKTPTLLFQDPSNKTIQLKDKLLDNKLYVLNSVFTAKKENDDLISYNVLVDFMFLQNTEMFILNIVDNSQMRQQATELTYLKGEKIRQYLALDNNQTAIYKKCGKPAIVCYFLYDDLTSFAQKNIQAEMDIEPEVVLTRSIAPIKEPTIQRIIPQFPQVPSLINLPHQEPRYEKKVEEHNTLYQKPVQAQQLSIPKLRNCQWILIGIFGLSMLFFLIAMIIMIVIFVRLNTSITLNGAIIQSKLFMTQSVQQPSQINAYLQSLPEPPLTYQSDNPGLQNNKSQQQQQLKNIVTQNQNIKNLMAVNTPNGIYLDNVTSSKIVSNHSKVDILSGMKQYCDSQTFTSLSQLPQNLRIISNIVNVTNLTVTNMMNSTQNIDFGTSIRINQLTVVGQLNATNITGTGTGTIQTMNCTGTFSQETLQLTTGNFGTYNAQGNVSVQNAVSTQGYSGNTFYATSINPGCSYQANGSIHAANLQISGANAELIFGETASLQNSLNFENNAATLRFIGTDFSATTSLNQPSGTMYGDITANQLNATTMTVQSPLNIPQITTNTTTAQTTQIAGEINSTQSTLTNVTVGTSVIIPNVMQASETGVSLTTSTPTMSFGTNMQVTSPNTIQFTNGSIGQSASFVGISGITQQQNLSFNQATVNGQTSSSNVQINGQFSNQGTLTTQNFIATSLTTQGAITVQNSFMSNTYDLTGYNKNPVLKVDTTDNQIKAWFDAAYSVSWKVVNGKIEQCTTTFLQYLGK